MGYTINERIAIAIEEIKKETGDSIEKVAENTFVNKSTIHRFKNSYGPSERFLKMLAHVYGFNYKWLEKGEGEMRDPSKLIK